jgi:hypothetical protein
MKLQPGEAAVLIIRRSETEPKTYFFALRKGRSHFNDTTKDFHLDEIQEAVLELGERFEFADALERGIEAIREIEP